jgi:hypothetical protein
VKQKKMESQPMAQIHDEENTGNPALDSSQVSGLHQIQIILVLALSKLLLYPISDA